MKRVLLLSLLFITSWVRSQDDRNVFSLKPALGMNGCQIHGDSYSGYDKIGFFGGVAVNAFLKKKLSAELGFYFSQKGSRHNPNPKAGDYSYYRVNLNYIDLPLLLRYELNSNYFVTAGPSLAYLVSYKEVINYADMTGYWRFNAIEASVNVGLGRKIKDQFYVEVRCTNSIIPVRDYGRVANLVFYPNPVARFFNKGLYNNLLTLLVCYKLDFKPKRENN